MRLLSMWLGIMAVAAAGCAQHTHSPRGGLDAHGIVRGGAPAVHGESAAGYSLAPVSDIQPPDYAEDKGPAQVFEIIRPDNRPLVLGRVWMDCVCVAASAEKTVFDKDERAFITVRHVQDAPVGGATFNLHVQLRAPIVTLLTHPVHVQ